MMPEMDGFTTCQRLREISDIPILIVSAMGQIEDITKALELGADDYLVKPVNHRELVARIQACVRRSPQPVEGENFITLGNGDLIIDPQRHRVMVRQLEIRLTKTEFELLHYLAQNRNRVLTHTMILEAVWGEDSEINKDTLKQFVLSLRKKLEKNPSKPHWLVSERGVGYALLIN
jgi:DNA-binding response OmpR family regulator